MKTLRLLLTAALSLTLMSATAHATPDRRWDAEVALQKARGALDRADQNEGMKRAFFRTKSAWDTYHAAKDAFAAGDFVLAEARARQAAREATVAAEIAANDDGRVRRLAERNALMTDVHAAGGITPVVTDDGVEFSWGGLFVATTANLSREGHRAVGLIAELAKRYPAFRVTVEGHVGDQSDKTLALTIAQRRAVALVDALEARGVDSARLRSTLNDEPYSTVVEGADFVFSAVNDS